MRRLVAAVFLFACGSSSTTGDGNPGNGDGDIVPDTTGGNAHAVKLTLKNRPMNGGAYSFIVAYQDGSAPWQLAPAPSGDTYTLTINAPSYGVAYACIGSVPGATTTQLRTVTSAHFAIGERTELTLDVPTRCSDRAAGNVTLSGSVNNRPFNGFLAVQLGTRTAFVGTSSGTFSLSTPPGTYDLVVAQVIPEGNGEFYVQSAVMQRGVAVTTSMTRTIDFSQAQPTRSWPVSINVAARAVASTTLYTSNGTQLGTVRESTGWDTIALAQSESSDIYDQSIAVTTAGQGATITNATNSPGAQTYAAPAPLGGVTGTIATTTPYITLESTWSPYANAIGYTWNATQQLASTQCSGNLPCTIVWTAMLSPGVLGANTGYRMPDLSGLMGWRQSYQFVGGAQIVGGVTATTSSVGASDFPTGIPANGTKRTFVRSDYAVTP